MFFLTITRVNFNWFYGSLYNAASRAASVHTISGMNFWRYLHAVCNLSANTRLSVSMNLPVTLTAAPLNRSAAAAANSITPFCTSYRNWNWLFVPACSVTLLNIFSQHDEPRFSNPMLLASTIPPLTWNRFVQTQLLRNKLSLFYANFKYHYYNPIKWKGKWKCSSIQCSPIAERSLIFGR